MTVQDLALAVPHPLAQVDRSSPSDQAGARSLGYEVHVELGRSMREARSKLRPQRQPDRRIGHRRDDAAVDDPLRVEVMWSELHGQLSPAVPDGHQLQARPLMKRRTLDPLLEIFQVSLAQPGPGLIIHALVHDSSSLRSLWFDLVPES